MSIRRTTETRLAPLRFGDDGLQLPAEFMAQLAAASARHEVSDVAARWTRRMVPTDRSTIWLDPSDGKGELVVQASSGVGSIGRDIRLRIDQSLNGTVHESRELVRVDDVVDLDVAESPAMADSGLRSALVAPLGGRGRQLGTIELASTAVAAFDERHETLLATIAGLIASFLTIHGETAQAVENARTDELTGHLNRRAVLAELDLRLAGSDRPALLYADIDGFKAINDAYGHAQGDEVLRELMRRMDGVLGADDALGRLGGDECLIVIPDDPEGKRARDVATRLIAACSEPFKIDQIEINPSVSVGVATGAGVRPDATRLVAEADMAMYVAKRSRSGLAVADDAMHRRAELEATIDRDLEQAFESGSLTFFYQPVRSLTSGVILGAEALLRWNHAELGWIPTPLLLERIDATGRTRSLTNWTLETVASNWVRALEAVPALAGTSVALNLSPRQLAWRDYPDAHARTLRRHGLRPTDIMIEVVESTEIQPGDMAEQTLRRIGDAQVTIALDDFGTGHNALGYFTRFPIHMIKLDRTLVGSAVSNRSARIIIGGLASMARELGVVALAEGIESDAEADACRDLDIDHGQGWHLGRPMALDQFIALAASESGGQPHAAPGLLLPR